MIIRGGFNIYPRELEEVLLTHPAVTLAAVAGVPHPSHGEEIKAFVVRAPGAELTEAGLIAWCKQNMAAYKYPRLVEFRDSLPMTATGKILKRELAPQEHAEPPPPSQDHDAARAGACCGRTSDISGLVRTRGRLLVDPRRDARSRHHGPHEPARAPQRRRRAPMAAELARATSPQPSASRRPVSTTTSAARQICCGQRSVGATRRCGWR